MWSLRVLSAGAVALATITGGLAPAHASPDTLTAPYSNASSDEQCRQSTGATCQTDATADRETGDIRASVLVEGAGLEYHAAGRALGTIVAAHHLPEEKESVDYTVNVHIAGAEAVGARPGLMNSFASVRLVASAHHQACEDCADTARLGVVSSANDEGAEVTGPRGVSVELAVRSADGAIPAGRVDIAVELRASASVSHGCFFLCRPFTQTATASVQGTVTGIDVRQHS